MLGRLAAVWLAVALTSCAFIIGPCEVRHGLVGCRQGGLLIVVLPAQTIIEVGDGKLEMRRQGR